MSSAFLNRILTVCLDELNPASTIAKPACMNSTSTAQMNSRKLSQRVGGDVGVGRLDHRDGVGLGGDDHVGVGVRLLGEGGR